MRFLIVNDNPEDRTRIAEELKEKYPGSSFVEVSRREDFVEIVARGEVDVAITDFRLGWSDGLWVLGAIRGRLPDVPVVMVSDSGSEEIAVAGMKAGLSDYVLKGALRRLPVAVSESLEKVGLRRERDAAIRDLAASEEKYRSLVDLSPDGIAVIDGEGRYVFINPAGASLLGASCPDQILGRSSLDFAHPDHTEAVRERIRLVKAGGTTVPFVEEKFVRLDGGVIRAEVAACSFHFQGGPASQVVFRDITERKKGEEALRLTVDRINALSRRLVEVQEAERRRVARELHDEIGQVLTGLKLALEMAEGLPDAAARDRLREARALINDLIARVRDLSLDLRPAVLDDLGLLPALLWHFGRFAAQTGVQVAFHHTGLEGRRFDPEVETGVYRITQEALTNIARHACVGDACVDIRAEADRLSLLVLDRGSGFDHGAALASGATRGCSGMRERAFLLGGQLRVESVPGLGTRLTAEIPAGPRRPGAET